MRLDSKKAFTLIEVMIVVAIIGLLSAIAIPNFIRVRETTQTNACIHNLRLIDAAKQQWALEFKKLGSDSLDYEDIQEYLSRSDRSRVIACPAGGTGSTFDSSYELNVVIEAPACKIVPETHALPF